MAREPTSDAGGVPAGDLQVQDALCEVLTAVLPVDAAAIITVRHDQPTFVSAPMKVPDWTRVREELIGVESSDGSVVTTLDGRCTIIRELRGDNPAPIGYVVLFNETRCEFDEREQELFDGLVEGALEHIEVEFLRTRNDYLEGEMRAMDRAEQALRSSERQLRQIIDASPMMVYVIDTEMQFEFANREFEAFFDVDREDIIGKRIDDVLDGDAVSFIKEGAERVLRGSGAIEVESSLSQQGQERTYLAQKFPIRAADGAARAICAIAADISRRKRVEEELRASEANYREIFDKVNDAIFIHSFEDGTIVDVNKKTEEMYGFSAEEFRESTPAMVSGGDPEVARHRALAMVEEAKNRPLVFEWHAKRKNGEMFWVEVNLKHATISGEERVIAIVRDISERKESERRRRMLEEQVRQAQKFDAVGRLAGAIAHEFNDLLSAILNNTELIDEQTEQTSRELAEIHEAAGRAAQLTRKLLVLGQKDVARPEIVNVSEAVDSLSPLLKGALGSQVDFETELSPDAESVWLDRAQFDQVIVNLTVNAREAMPEGGTFRVATALERVRETERSSVLAPGEYVCLSVTDTGIGMSDAVLEHALDPFFTTKLAGAGAGLGLSMVYSIVSKVGGDVRLRSSPGGGTTVDVLLPHHRDEDEEVDAEERVPEEAAPDAKIMIVEDEPTVLRALRRVLEREGYTLLVARSADEALEISGTHDGHIDLLLTDVVLPGKSGLDLAAELRLERPKTHVIFMSGHSKAVASHEKFVSGDGELMMKPFSSDKLRRAVRRQLSTGRANVSSLDD